MADKKVVTLRYNRHMPPKAIKEISLFFRDLQQDLPNHFFIAMPEGLRLEDVKPKTLEGIVKKLGYVKQETDQGASSSSGEKQDDSSGG